MATGKMMAQHYQTTPTGPAQGVPTARDVPLEDQVLEVFSPSPVPTCSTSSPLDTILTDLPDLDYFSCKTMPDIIPPSCPIMNTQPASSDLSAQVYGSPEFAIHDVDIVSCNQPLPVQENISLQQNKDMYSSVDVSLPPQQTMQHQYLPQYPQVPGNHLVPLGDQASEYQHLDQQQQMFQNYPVILNQYPVVMDQHQILGHCPHPKTPPPYHHTQSSGHVLLHKKRARIQKEQKELLEAEFGRNSRPSAIQLEEIAARLIMDKNVVRVWFCNKRQKVKRQAAM